MPRIKQRYLEELEHEFATTGQVILHERFLAKVLTWVLVPIGGVGMWILCVFIMFRYFPEATIQNPLSWILLASICIVVIMVPVAFVKGIIQLVRPSPQHRLETRDWVITPQGMFPPDGTRTSTNMPPLFYAWDDIAEISAARLTSRWPWPPYTTIIKPREHAVERIRVERPHLKATWTFYDRTGDTRPTYIQWMHTRRGYTLAEFLKQCKERYGHTPKL